MPKTALILIGTHYHPGDAASLTRQNLGRQSLLKLPEVKCVNLQFPDIPAEFDGFECIPKLFGDSNSITGRKGARKPLGFDAFNLIARRAKDDGSPFFSWINADIIALPSIVTLLETKMDAYCISRMDVDPIKLKPVEFHVAGFDLFIFKTSWWFQNAQRFRNYINSEALWDIIYTSICMCHGKSRLINRGEAVILHPQHPKAWGGSPFSDYNVFLSCLDGLYLEMWTKYAQKYRDLVNQDADEDMFRQIQKECFTWPPSCFRRLKQYGRSVKAYGRYYLNKNGIIRSVHYYK
jgi:hypothetical protein